MASVAAYECPFCGGLRFSSEGSTNPVYAAFPHYTNPHVCNPERIAEHRYISDPRAEFPAELQEPPK